MTRYIFVADIHGEVYKLIHALKKVKFDKDKDVLVSVGDPFDRGDHNVKVLEFLMSLPNSILIWGNHDSRLSNLCLSKVPLGSYDVNNGTIKTVIQLAGENAFDSDDLIADLRKSPHYQTLLKYFNRCVWAAEFDKFVATHAWVPHYQAGKIIQPMESWRTATLYHWENSTWARVDWCIESGIFPDKPLLIGHWYAAHIAKIYGEEYKGGAYQSPDGKIIALDGWCNLDRNEVNVYVYETNVKPILYGGGER